MHGSIMFSKIDLSSRYHQISVNKYVFCTHEVTFVNFVVGSHGVKVDEEKENSIKDWPTPKTIGEVRSFHGHARFYRRFVKDFGTLTTPSNEIVKKKVFVLNGRKAKREPSKYFSTLKLQFLLRKMYQGPR
ncbi:Retrovirus-related Pol polyprotein from transposon gypsy, partial [Mucuna pruriens]